MKRPEYMLETRWQKACPCARAPIQYGLLSESDRSYGIIVSRPLFQHARRCTMMGGRLQYLDA